jgi:hypothetical protein
MQCTAYQLEMSLCLLVFEEQLLIQDNVLSYLENFSFYPYKSRILMEIVSIPPHKFVRRPISVFREFKSTILGHNPKA